MQFVYSFFLCSKASLTIDLEGSKHLAISILYKTVVFDGHFFVSLWTDELPFSLLSGYKSTEQQQYLVGCQ